MSAPKPSKKQQFLESAEIALKTIREQCGAALGYDESSIVWIDEYIERHRRNVLPKVRESLVQFFGAIFGECVRRRAGGRWTKADGVWAVRVDSGTLVFPFARVHKQFENGPEDSIAASLRSVPVRAKLKARRAD
ncbi:MAG: hypothetical protein HY059_13870 [Proteobacteria bacterium]|nr:hypothetical protein [Pseudomonadota bacterium]